VASQRQRIRQPNNATQVHRPKKQRSSSSATVTGGVLELRFLLDHASVGGVIGRGGASVRSVRESSLVHLAIVKAEPRQAQERIMVLKGTTAQISNAVKQIAQLSDITHTRAEKDTDPSPSAARRTRPCIKGTAHGRV